LNTQKFVMVNGRIVNTSQIKGGKIVDMKETDMLLSSLDEETKNRVLGRMKTFKQNLGRKPTATEIQKFINNP
jgi:hypothetical protein